MKYGKKYAESVKAFDLTKQYDAEEAVSILLKAAGIGLLSELAGLLCADAGENALGKVLQILSNAAILWLSLPLFRQIIGLIGEVLAKI